MTSAAFAPTYGEKWIEYRKRKQTCPICGKGDRCKEAPDGAIAMCFREAAGSFKEVAGGIAWLHRLKETRPITSFPAVLHATQPTRHSSPEKPAAIQENRRADAQTLHVVYAALLNSLELRPTHTALLTDPNGDRRMSAAEVAAFGVKSAPTHDINVCKELTRRFGTHTLLTVPGFYRDPTSGIVRLNLSRHAMLLPSRCEGQITGIQMRPDAPGDGPKYYWLSSATERLAERGIVGPMAWLQAGLWQPLSPIQRPRTVGITEGAFKAFRAANTLGYPFISTPGTSSWQSAGVVALAQKIAGCGGKAVVFYDSELNTQTRRQRDALADALMGAGLQVEIATWTRHSKGIDDLLLAGGMFAIHPHIPTVLPVHNRISARYLPPIKIGGLSAAHCAGVTRRNGNLLFPTCPTLDLTHKVTLIKSSKGSGKSERIARLLAELPPESSVLVIGHRVALLRELARRFGLALYLDYKGLTMDRKGLSGAKRLAICADSLIHLGGQQLAAYEFVIMDESEQELRHLTSSTVAPKRRTVWVTQNALLRRAKRIICLDADMSHVTYRYMARLLGIEHIEVIENAYRRDDMPRIFKYSGSGARASLQTALLAKLKGGERCFVASNSANAAHLLTRLIRAELPKLRVLCVSQETAGEPDVARILANLNQSVTAYDCLITSPTANTGLDISVKHFGTTFVLGVRGSTTHSDLLQHMARNRAAKEIHAYIEPGIGDQSTDPDHWRQECIAKHHMTSLLVEYDDNGERIAAPHEQDYLALWADIKAAEAASRNDLAGNFYRQAPDEGHEIVPVIPDPTATTYDDPAIEALAHAALTTGAALAAPAPKDVVSFQNRVRETKEALRDERYTAIIDAPELLPSEAAKLESAGCRTAQERASLERHRIEDYYGLPADRQLVELDGGGRLMGRLTNFMALTGMLDPVERDRVMLENGEKLLPDMRHLTAATAMRRKVLRAAGLFTSDGKWDMKLALHTTKMADFTVWLQQPRNARHIKRWLGISVKKDVADKPVEFIATVLAQCGLTLQHRRCGSRNARLRTAQLNREQLVIMEVLSHARTARKHHAEEDDEEIMR